MINQLKRSIKSVQKCASIRGGFLPDIITKRNAEDVECLPLHWRINSYCLHSSYLLLLLCTLRWRYYISLWKHEQAEDTKERLYVARSCW